MMYCVNKYVGPRQIRKEIIMKTNKQTITPTSLLLLHKIKSRAIFGLHFVRSHFLVQNRIARKCSKLQSRKKQGWKSFCQKILKHVGCKFLDTLFCQQFSPNSNTRTDRPLLISRFISQYWRANNKRNFLNHGIQWRSTTSLTKKGRQPFHEVLDICRMLL